MNFEKTVRIHLEGFGWMTGRELRKRINAGKWWICQWSSVGFYAGMARLEDEGKVDRFSASLPNGDGSLAFCWKGPAK